MTAYKLVFELWQVVFDAAMKQHLIAFVQHITAAIMPPAAFVAVPRLPPPPLESQLLLPADSTEQVVKKTLQLTSHDSDSGDKDIGSLQDYQQQTVISSSLLLRRSNTEYNDQLM